MTAEEQGVYRNLLDELWLRNGLLTTDERALAKIGGDPEAWPRVRVTVLARFTKHPAGYRHDTHDEVSSFPERQAEKGRKRAATALREGGRFTSQTPAGAPAPHQPPSPSPSPSPITVSESVSVSEQKINGVISHVGDESPKSGVVFTGGHKESAFDAFWRAYPKKRDRKEAEILWKKLKPDTELRAQIMIALQSQKISDQWIEEGGRYVPKAAKWLEHGDWQKLPPSNNGTKHTRIGEQNLRVAESLLAKYGAK